MILIFDYRKTAIILFASLAITVLVFLSINYLFAGTDSDQQTIVQGSTAGNTTDLQYILEENSLFDDYLFEIEGTGSYYGKKFHKRKTASGERYNMFDYTCAHKNLPFGTILKVTNLSNNKSTLVRINDRGPFVGKRFLDLSMKSAEDVDGKGVPKLKIEGFSKNNFDVPFNFRNEYYFVYSFKYKPFVIPSNYLVIRHSFNDFSSAVSSYKELIESGLSDSLTTFIVFDEATFNTFGDDEVYHIAVWNRVSNLTIPEMVAEKVYITK